MTALPNPSNPITPDTNQAIMRQNANKKTGQIAYCGAFAPGLKFAQAD